MSEPFIVCKTARQKREEEKEEKEEKEKEEEEEEEEEKEEEEEEERESGILKRHDDNKRYLARKKTRKENHRNLTKAGKARQVVFVFSLSRPTASPRSKRTKFSTRCFVHRKLSRYREGKQAGSTPDAKVLLVYQQRQPHPATGPKP